MALHVYEAQNVLGSELEPCSEEPLTGFFRDGLCQACKEDTGQHTVCCVVTSEFLAYSAKQGNDLSTPRPEFDFPGLKEGDSWCLCAGRWLQAFEDGMAPRVRLMSTHYRTLDIVPLDSLKSLAVDLH